ncbi:MAG TPA: hypothetical protein VIN03_22660 [Roseateles sp.]
MSDPWPFGSFLDRHPRIALALLVAVIFLQMAADGLLEQMQ